MRQTLAQLVLGLGALGIFCTGAAFCYWTLQGAVNLWTRGRSWQRRRAVNRIKREQMTEHWVRTEGWK